MSTTVTVLQDKVITVEVAGGFPQGNGIPTGGTTGQVLVKNSGTNYDVEWSSVVAGSATWGSINGNIADQTDLVAALDAAGRVYVQESEPGLDTEDGDIWFQPTTELFKIKSSGVWTTHGHDDGYF